MVLANRLLTERPPVLSYTALRRFQECGMQEALLRSGLPRAVPDRRKFLVGNVIHKALEISLARGVVLAGHELFQVFQDQSRKPGLRWRSRSDARDLLERSVLTYAQVWKVLKAEVDIEKSRVFVEEELSVTPYGHEFIALARPDLIINTGEELVVWDIKSSYRPVLDARQLYWYAGVIYYGRQKRRVIPTCRFIHPTDSGVAKVVEIPVEVPDFRAVYREAAVLCDAILAVKFEASPEPYRCRYCRVRPSCAHSAFRGHRGRAVAASRGTGAG